MVGRQDDKGRVRVDLQRFERGPSDAGGDVAPARFEERSPRFELRERVGDEGSERTARDDETTFRRNEPVEASERRGDRRATVRQEGQKRFRTVATAFGPKSRSGAARHYDGANVRKIGGCVGIRGDGSGDRRHCDNI